MEERLKKARNLLNKTQKEMSALLGLGEITWQNYERGVTKPKFDTLEKLSELGFNPSWITDGTTPIYKDDVRETSVYIDSNSSINKTQIFNMVLSELKDIYKDYPTSDMDNSVEIKAFNTTLNILNFAKDDVNAMQMIEFAISQEKANLKDKS